MFKIGLTGGIGSGKTDTAQFFSEFDVPVIDADDIAHQLVKPGSDALSEISKTFGDHFLTSEGDLDRKKLSRLIFQHPDKKKLLENILHPRVRRQILNDLEICANEPYAVLVIPLLIEAGFEDMVDRVLLVDASNEVRINRIHIRDQRNEEEIAEIMQNQLGRDSRLQHADDILDNNGSLSKLKTSVQKLHQRYLTMANKQ